MAKSFEEVLTTVVTDVNTTIGSVDTRVGTVLRDAILAPISSEIASIYSNVETIGNSLAVDSINISDTSGVNRLAQNYGVNRLTGSRAYGTVRFYVSNLSSTDSIDIPVFTSISTNSSTSVSYKTLAAKILDTTYYDTNLQAYYVDVPVLCDQVGTLGNAFAGTIVIQNIRGIDGVVNLFDFTNGSDTQTNNSLVATVKSTARGNAGSSYGYESLIRQNFTVNDIKTISPDSSDSIGGQGFGYTDIVVLTDQTLVGEDSVVFVSPDVTTEITPVLKPMTAVYEISGIGTTGGIDTPIVLNEGATADYEVFYDKASLYAYGVNSLTKIYLHVRPEKNLNENSVLSFKYYYSNLIDSINLFLETPENKTLGSNILVKSGILVPVVVNAKIKPISGYTQADVIARTATAITDYLATFLLGQAVQSSDIVSVISGVIGVDSVNITDFELSIADEPTILQEIAPSLRQYLRCSSPTVTVEA